MAAGGSAAEKLVRLDQLPLGRRATVRSLAVEGLTRRRLLDLGVVPGTIIEPVLASLLGDPRAYRLRGSLLALRDEDARQIGVAAAEEA